MSPSSRIILLPALCGAIGVLGSFIYSGGYYERWPLLDRFSGPARFEEYVASPIPAAFTDFRGGYSGFPGGTMKVLFHHQNGPAALDPMVWHPVSKQEREGLAPDMTGEPVSLAEFDRAVIYQKADKQQYLFFFKDWGVLRVY